MASLLSPIRKKRRKYYIFSSEYVAFGLIFSTEDCFKDYSENEPFHFMHRLLKIIFSKPKYVSLCDVSIKQLSKNGSNCKQISNIKIGIPSVVLVVIFGVVSTK